MFIKHHRFKKPRGARGARGSKKENLAKELAPIIISTPFPVFPVFPALPVVSLGLVANPDNG
jgi:hypothetical protein